MWLLLALVAKDVVPLEALRLTGYKISNRKKNKEFGWVVDKVTVSQNFVHNIVSKVVESKIISIFRLNT